MSPRIVLLTAALLPFAASAQTAVPIIPRTPVAIENTNAAFVPTDVDIPQANAARPTVTIPAHIPPTGYLQFEQGFVVSDTSPAGVASQKSLSQTTKIALTTRIMAQFITSPYARSTVVVPAQSPTPTNDPGDLDLGANVVAVKSVGALPTVAVGYLRRVRAGTSANLDLGDFLQSALVLLGGDLPHGFHYDSNLLFNEQTSDPARRLQLGQTLAVTHTIFPITFKQRLASIVELSHFTQPFVTTTSRGFGVAKANAVDLLFVATYTPRPNLILDMSFSKGLTSTSTQWQGGFGFTYLLPHRLWPDRHPRVLK